VIGALAAAAQLLGAPVALAASRVVRRWGTAPTIAAGTLAMAVSILPIALIPHWAAAGLGYIGLITGFALTAGPVRVFMQRIVSPRWRGTTSGAVMSGVGLINAVMSVGGGYAVSTMGFRGMFLIGAALTAAGALLFGWYFRVPRGEFAGSNVKADAE
jgi:predicted MFS family arabinose efflux permease